MRIAIIGASGHYPYVVSGVQGREDISIVAIAPGTQGEDISSLLRACQQAGENPAVYLWWETLIAQEAVDVVAVNPWYCHSAAITRTCLRRGIPVYSEKPVATTLSELTELKEAYVQGTADLGCMLDGRHTSWLRTARKAVDAGRIGEVRLLHGQKSYKMGTRGPQYQRIETYGGMLAWIAIHPVSWFGYLLGTEPMWVSAQTSDRQNGGNGEMESTGCMLLRYPQGVIATVSADFYRPTGAPRHDDDRIRITGTKGMIEVIDGAVYLEDAAGRSLLPLETAENPFLFFADALGTPSARAQAETAFSVAHTCLMARKAAEEGVCLPL